MKADCIISSLLQKNNGIIRTADIGAAGLSRTTIMQLVKDGKLIRVAHGQYMLSDNLPDDLYIIQQRSKQIIYSHETALFLHNIAERTPSRHTLTIPSNSKLSPSLSDAVKIYYVKPDLHNMGICHIPSKMGHMVTVYNIERTICDVLRSRNRIDSQTISSAMKEYATRSKKNWVLLREYADVFRVTELLRQYLEVLV